jgi:peptidyl-prolyl cis-trans isomerase SurA
MTDLKDYARTRKNRILTDEALTNSNGETKEILEQFITEKLIAAEINRMGIRVSEEDIDRYIENVQKKNQISAAEMITALRREGMEMEQYRTKIRAELEKGILISRQVEKKVNIFPDDVERYYQANKIRFMTKERAHLLHLLIRILDDATPEQEKAALTKASEIRKRALQGEDFSKLVREYSDGAGASEGGDIGWVDRSSLLNAIAKVAFKLSAGEVSQPVRTSLGVHLIKLVEHQPAKLTPLSEVEKNIREHLYTKALEKRFQRWLSTDLRKKHLVDVKIPGFVFRVEETKDTVDSRIASASESDIEERGLFSFLNPFSSFFSDDEPPVDYGSGDNLSDESVVTLFGTPLFVTYDGDNSDEPLIPSGDEPLIPSGNEPLIPSGEGAETGESEESQGFFSTMWDSITPF